MPAWQQHAGRHADTPLPAPAPHRYSSIVRLFLLPKPNSPHTLVVVSLDPPIRKGNTYYSHLLCQFTTDDEDTIELDLADEALAAKNERVRGWRGKGREARLQGCSNCCRGWVPGLGWLAGWATARASSLCCGELSRPM